MSSSSFHEVARHYFFGLGVKKNYCQAIKYYKLAAKNGDQDACQSVAYMYQEGLGTKKSNRWARYWDRKIPRRG